MLGELFARNSRWVLIETQDQSSEHIGFSPKGLDFSLSQNESQPDIWETGIEKAPEFVKFDKDKLEMTWPDKTTHVAKIKKMGENCIWNGSLLTDKSSAILVTGCLERKRGSNNQS
eukprot:TRINITY_DN13791_c0_g1_i1.p2 TRINITY_DN13791_c0_g1~~TRINITY_DN13791_c0_g1_i1.p2  ORF type:complete len:116 (-),score=29.24 TRINITY_DN13791_c0_g1_i1:306-653(-)